MVDKAEVQNMRRIAMIAWLLAVGCGGSEFGTDGVGSNAAVGGAAGAAAGAAGSQPYDGGLEAADAFTGGSGGAAGHSDAMPPDSSAGSSGEGGSAGEAGAGPDAGGDVQPTCSQDEHVCAGQCVENTPDNGCAVQCAPCDEPDNAHAVCGSQGECAWECDAGCEQTAAGCVCPVHECCDYAECGGSSTCIFGVCQVSPYECSQDECVSWCLFCHGKPGGFCNSGGGCQCD